MSAPCLECAGSGRVSAGLAGRITCTVCHGSRQLNNATRLRAIGEAARRHLEGPVRSLVSRAWIEGEHVNDGYAASTDGLIRDIERGLRIVKEMQDKVKP